MKKIASGHVLSCCGVVFLLVAIVAGWLIKDLRDLGVGDAGDLGHVASVVSSMPRIPQPGLSLDPSEGAPDTSTPFTIYGIGYGIRDDSTCAGEFPRAYLFWDETTGLVDEASGVASVPMSFGKGGGEFEANVSVPQGAATPGEHLVSAQCGNENPSAIFTIPASPVLTLSPDVGGPDELFTVEGEGYSHCNYRCSEGDRLPGVEIIWASTGEVIATAVMTDEGTFTAVDVPVPPTAAPGDYEIIGRFGAESAQETFFVAPPATLSLNPSEGPIGAPTPFTVRGSGYYTDDCLEHESPSAEVFWDETTRFASASMSFGKEGGEFEANVSVPQGAATPGEHLVSAQCGNENPSEIFTIPAAPVLTLNPSAGDPDTLFTVEGEGYSHCNYRCPEGDRLPGVEVVWASTGEVIATAVMSDEGTFTVADVSVPHTAAPGDHEVIARFGTESADATFVVPTPSSPTLALYPYLGNPGSPFEVSGDGYSPCTSGGCPPVEILWGMDNEIIGIGTMGSDGGFSVRVDVPPTAVPGNYQVLARFGMESAAASFAVVPRPVVKLYPYEGRSDTEFTIEGSGYGRCYGTCSHASQVSEVTVLWGVNEEVLTTTEMRSDGTFTAKATVPSTATPGKHLVVGRFGAESAEASFIVEPPPVNPEIFDSILIPDTGRSGDFFRVEGSGYDKCPDRGNRTVDIYDRNIPDSDGFRLALARDVPLGAEGAFSTVVQMPFIAPAGRHEINIQCFGGREYTSRIFTVTDPVAPLPGSPSDPSGARPVDPLPEFPLRPEDIVEPPDGGSVKRAYLTTQVPVLTDVFNDPMRLLKALLFAFLLVLIVAFPAELFNNTYEKNHEKIDGWLGKWFRWLPRLSPRNQPSWIHLNILGLFAAVLLLMVFVRDLAFDYATLAQVTSYLLAVPLVVIVLEFSGEVYSRWKGAGSIRPGRYRLHGPQWRILPSALIVAGFLALLSKLASFSPPYVYGLIAVYLGADRLLSSLTETEEKKEKGRRVLVGVLFLSVASAVAWLIWSRLYSAFDHELNGFGWLILDGFLVTFFLIGLETAIFGLIPLAFLKGKELWGWSRTLWAVAFAPVVFLFVNVHFVMREREIPDPTLTQMIKPIILFVIFGIISILFWGCFHPTVQNTLVQKIRNRFSHSVHR